MGEVVNPTVIKQTQDLLGKYVTKPVLSTKLLGKPPFKYLHDIIAVVISETGFMKGLYTDEELSSENIKDKEAKVNFLQKAIDAAGLAVGEELPVRPNKIVAGHEVEKTNLWLQKLANAIDKKVDSEKIVKQVLSGVKPEKSKSSTKSEAKKSESDKTKKKSSKTKEERPSKTKTSSSSSSKPQENGKPSRDKSVDAKKESKSKDRSGKKEKTEKSKSSKSKSEDGKVKESSKSSKDSSKSRSRSSSKTNEKENSPPKESNVTEPVEVAEERVPSSMRVKSGRAKTSTINDLNGEPPQENGFDGDPPGPEDAGPNSLLQVDTEESPLEMGTANSEIEPQRPADIEIDPAILKAIGSDVTLGNNGLMDTEGPSDSGVGSLESPKTLKDEDSPTSRMERSPTAPDEPITPKTNGPTPLKAYHPDLPDETGSPMAPDDIQQERPTTGRGIRPRTGRRSARPSSARPAPPKVRERKEVPQEELPRPPTGKIVQNLILDNRKGGDGILDDDAEDENFTVGESKPLMDEDLASLTSLTGTKDFDKDTQELMEGNSDGKGLLVAQIIETKKELEDDRRQSFSPETPGHRRVPIESGLGDTNRRREKEAIQREVDKLTSSIQLLTRSVNPLAKMLDYLQEDLDSMKKELETWRNENKKLKQNLKGEQSLTEQTLEPLKSQLEDLESAIYDQRDQISAVKSNIIRNKDRIKKLLAGMNT